MTVAVIIAGQLPMMMGGWTGSEVMRRIAARMVDAMITAPILSVLVLPAAYLLWRAARITKTSSGNACTYKLRSQIRWASAPHANAARLGQAAEGAVALPLHLFLVGSAASWGDLRQPVFSVGMAVRHPWDTTSGIN